MACILSLQDIPIWPILRRHLKSENTIFIRKASVRNDRCLLCAIRKLLSAVSATCLSDKVLGFKKNRENRAFLHRFSLFSSEPTQFQLQLFAFKHFNERSHDIRLQLLAFKHLDEGVHDLRVELRALAVSQFTDDRLARELFAIYTVAVHSIV